MSLMYLQTQEWYAVYYALTMYIIIIMPVITV